MNRKITLIAATPVVLSLAIFAFAYGTGGSSTQAGPSCCPKSDSCPMKKKDASATADTKAMDCDNCGCCKNGSCPMHKKEGAADSCPMHNKDAAMDYSKMHKMDGAMESCPMHKAEGAEMRSAAMSNDGKSCDCSCCSHEKEKKNAEAAV